MKKSTKGAVAAAAAGVLLLGGAGSLAYWTAEDSVDGGDITAGDLTLDGVGCDADWVYADGAASEGEPVVLFVPGDEITKQCTFTVGATGDNLSAALTAPETVDITTTPEVDLEATVDATYAIGAAPIADGDLITEDNDGDTITVTFDVTIDYGTADVAGPPPVAGVNGNLTQNITAALDDLTVSLVQQDPNA